MPEKVFYVAVEGLKRGEKCSKKDSLKYKDFYLFFNKAPRIAHLLTGKGYSLSGIACGAEFKDKRIRSVVIGVTVGHRAPYRGICINAKMILRFDSLREWGGFGSLTPRRGVLCLSVSCGDRRK